MEFQADLDGDDKITWSEFVEEFYGLSADDEANILAMDTDTGVEFNHMYSRDQVFIFPFNHILKALRLDSKQLMKTKTVNSRSSSTCALKIQ